MIPKGLCHFERDQKLMKRIHFLWLEWEKVFPNVRIDREAMAAHEWLVRNIEVKKDYARYLSNWFKREQRKYDMLPKAQPYQRGETALEKQKKYEANWQPDMTVTEMEQIRRQNLGQISINGKNMKEAIETEAL